VAGADLPATIARLRELLAKATPGPWFIGHNPDGRDPMAYIGEAYSYGPPGRVHLVCVPIPGKSLDDEALFTAVTGNGPTSEANAALVADAVTALPAILDALDAATTVLARIHAAIGAERTTHTTIEGTVHCIVEAVAGTLSLIEELKGDVAAATERADANANVLGCDWTRAYSLPSATATSWSGTPPARSWRRSLAWRRLLTCGRTGPMPQPRRG